MQESAGTARVHLDAVDSAFMGFAGFGGNTLGIMCPVASSTPTTASPASSTASATASVLGGALPGQMPSLATLPTDGAGVGLVCAWFDQLGYFAVVTNNKRRGSN